MPEAFAVLLVLVVCVAAYVAALLTARHPAQQNTAEDLVTLHRHRAWLQQRLEMAQRENWGDDMVESIAAELTATAEQIAARDVARR
jgi:hypothetical protein